MRLLTTGPFCLTFCWYTASAWGGAGATFERQARRGDSMLPLPYLAPLGVVQATEHSQKLGQQRHTVYQESQWCLPGVRERAMQSLTSPGLPCLVRVTLCKKRTQLCDNNMPSISARVLMMVFVLKVRIVPECLLEPGAEIACAHSALLWQISRQMRTIPMWRTNVVRSFEFFARNSHGSCNRPALEALHWEARAESFGCPCGRGKELWMGGISALVQHTPFLLPDSR